MPITVSGPGGVTVDFPDGTDHATMDKAMREKFGKGEAEALPPSEPSFGEEVLKGATDPVRGTAQLLKNATGIGSATAQPGGEGVQKEKKVQGSADSDEMTAGRMLGGFIPSAIG